jgi:hypothetical protein
MDGPRVSGGFWRGYLLGGASLLLLGLIWSVVSQPPPAYGQVPDSGAQRARMVQELVTANKKLTEITDLLKDIRALNAGKEPARKPKTPGREQP